MRAATSPRATPRTWDATDCSGNHSGQVSQTITTRCPCFTGCALTQGYWKNHTEAWPVSSLTLGSVSYTAADLESILEQPVGSDPSANGLIALAHQLIAAKLNAAAGTSVPSDVPVKPRS